MKTLKVVLKSVEIYVPLEKTEVNEKAIDLPVWLAVRLQKNLAKYKSTREKIDKFLAEPKKVQEEEVKKDETVKQ